VSKRPIYILGGVVAVCALAGLVWYEASGPAKDPAIATAVTAAPPEIIGKDEPHALGDPKAKVTLIEYAAPRCPHCARFEINVFPDLKKAYIDTGKVHFVFRVFPLSEDDGNAEKLGRCLSPDLYFDFMDMLFRNQPSWDDEYGVMDVKGGLVQMARTAGMKPDQARACMANKQTDIDINKTASDAVARYQVDATPTLVVNGKVQQPPPGQEWSFEALSQVLDAAAKS
jgi:protein-disulfide isomerase